MPTGRPMAQVRWLSPKVGSRLALFCINRVNRANSWQLWVMMSAP